MFMSDLRETLMNAIGQTQTDAAQELLPEKNAGFKGKRILLVEDNELNREIAQELLQEYGFLSLIHISSRSRRIWRCRKPSPSAPAYSQRCP